MSETAKWYVAHTYSGYENKVKANIEKTIANRHLEEQILEVCVPPPPSTALSLLLRKSARHTPQKAGPPEKTAEP
ncbi:MAG: hypothetical protein HFH57_11835, partial [Lachnospiraceae bacterium]|nr:hypothetical protein [Lachnospiraceae bacterium]